ncbi:MAG: hypothetical protein ACI91Z_000840 [Yoonia sp.]|jgi:hypothetical protein
MLPEKNQAPCVLSHSPVPLKTPRSASIFGKNVTPIRLPIHEICMLWTAPPERPKYAIFDEFRRTLYRFCKKTSELRLNLMDVTGHKSGYQDAYDRNVESLHSVGLVLPRISDLADPPAKLAAKMAEIADTDPDAPDARNFFRVHWYNGTDRRSLVQVPEHVVLTEAITGPSLQRVFDHLNVDGDLNARAFVAATGSAGTLAAADHLKQSLGTQTGVIEAIACPNLHYNGYREHNIQGIGDKHVPLTHNVMGSDFVIDVSDASCDSLILVFNTTAGRAYRSEHGGLSQDKSAHLATLVFPPLQTSLVLSNTPSSKTLTPKMSL